MKYIGTRRELFVDDWLVAGMEGLSFELHRPNPAEIVLRPDTPWESGGAYVTVFQDGNRFRMYYRGQGTDGPANVCMAESEDGIHWERPELNLFTVNGSSANNIVWAGDDPYRGTHNFSVFKDANPDAPDDERYKALTGYPLHALASADGIHWRKLQQAPVITEEHFDSQNVVFWDQLRELYVCYKRHKPWPNHVRSIARTVSTDFRRWSRQEPIETGAPEEHLYTSAAVPYFRAHHIYLAFPKRFMPERKKIQEHPSDGVSDGVFMSSRDGINWDRRFMEAFLRPGPDPRRWTDRNNMISCGILQTDETELSIYWREHSKHPTSRLRRGTLRLDGFVSIHAGYDGGEFLTHPFIFAGDELRINYATSAAGSIQVEIQDRNGEAVPGFGLTEPIYGDEIDVPVSWAGGENLGELAGEAVRLRFRLKDADLYAIQFAKGET